ncbi:MAG: hypothetical protein HYY93_13550 [Planctomycetes bacterium]|nr:hypothetical protein [Planctomycetota bacterium]
MESPNPAVPALPIGAAPPVPRRRSKWKWVFIVALVMLGLYVFYRTQISPFAHLEAIWKDSPLTRMRPPEFEKRVSHDLTELAGHRGGLDALTAHFSSLRARLPAEARSLTPEQRRALKECWAAFLDYEMALDDLKGLYEAFPGVNRLSGGKDNWRHARSFAIAYLIHLLQIDASRPFIDAFIGNADYESVMDEKDDVHGIPPAAFGRLKTRVVHVQTMTEVAIFHRYHEGLRDGHYAPYAAAEPGAPDGWVVAEIDRRHLPIDDWYKAKGLTQLTSNAADILKEDLFARWFPVQTGIAEWMGDTRVTSGPNLITIPQIHEMLKAMEPGDIILERRNWYLSNVGLPGFWPHAELYIGTPDEFSASFDPDPEVRAWCAAAGAGTPRELVARRFPELASTWARHVDGEPPRIIESVSEGVVLSPAEHGCLADYIGVLRPRLRKVDKLQAILTAFGHWGKPYDFNFDFITDDTIVCSELVFKAYRPDGEKLGLNLHLKEVMGRKVWPSNEFVGVFRDELGKPEAQMDFVWFYDGVQGERKAIVSGARELAETCSRPKWCMLQK